MITKFETYQLAAHPYGKPNELNKILVVDSSGSFSWVLLDILKNVNLYLDDEFTFIYYDYIDQKTKSFITNLDELTTKSMVRLNGSNDGIVSSVKYIIDNNLRGNVVILSDGVLWRSSLDLSPIKDWVAFLVTTEKPESIIKGPNHIIFKDNLESTEHYYPPRDETDGKERWEIRKTTKKFNL